MARLINKLPCKILNTLIGAFFLVFVLGFGLALALFVHGRTELALFFIKISFISSVIYGLLCEVYKRGQKGITNE